MIREIPLSNCNGNRLILSGVKNYSGSHEEKSFYSVKYVKKGVEEYKIGSTTYPVPSNSFLLTDGYAPYEIWVNSNDSVEGMCLFIPYALLLDVFQNLQRSESSLLDYPGDPSSPFEIKHCIYADSDSELGSLLARVYGEFQKADSYHNDASALFYLIAKKILLHVKRAKPAICHNKLIGRATLQELVKRLLCAKTQLDEEPGREWQMKDLALSVGMSEYHFFRTFKKIFHISPYQYLLQKRMQLACKLLDEGEYNVGRIAFLCGFSDIYCFSKTFKKYFSISPTQRQKAKLQGGIVLQA